MLPPGTDRLGIPRAAAPDGGTLDPPMRDRRQEGRLRPPTAPVALALAAAVVVGIGLWLGREALNPFVVGLLLVYLLAPSVEWLSARRVPRWLAILIVYAIVLVGVVQALSLTLRPLVDQIRSLSEDLPGLLAGLERSYQGLSLSPQIRDALDHWLQGLAQGGGIGIGAVLPVVNLTASVVSSIFGYLIIPVWAFFLLKDRHNLTAASSRSLPLEWRADALAIARIVEQVFSQWIRAQLFLGLVVGVATFVGLMLLNATVDPIFGRFALLLAIVAGLFELLPIIGPILAAIPAVLLALTAGPEAAFAAFVLYLVVQQLENNLLVPKIQGDAVKLHPSVVMFALVMGGAIGGLLGAILALPITAAARDIFRYLFQRLTPRGKVGLTGADIAAPDAGGA